MNFDDYQNKAITTDVFSKTDDIMAIDFINQVLGLVGESGEFADKIKKLQRNQKGLISDIDRKELIKELGDVLWYISTIAYYLDVPLSTVAEDNLIKLFDRKARGVIKSQGDNR